MNQQPFNQGPGPGNPYGAPPSNPYGGGPGAPPGNPYGAGPPHGGAGGPPGNPYGAPQGGGGGPPGNPYGAPPANPYGPGPGEWRVRAVLGRNVMAAAAEQHLAGECLQQLAQRDLAALSQGFAASMCRQACRLVAQLRTQQTQLLSICQTSWFTGPAVIPVQAYVFCQPAYARGRPSILSFSGFCSCWLCMHWHAPESG